MYVPPEQGPLVQYASCLAPSPSSVRQFLPSSEGGGESHSRVLYRVLLPQTDRHSDHSPQFPQLPLAGNDEGRTDSNTCKLCTFVCRYPNQERVKVGIFANCYYCTLFSYCALFSLVFNIFQMFSTPTISINLECIECIECI